MYANYSKSVSKGSSGKLPPRQGPKTDRPRSAPGAYWSLLAKHVTEYGRPSKRPSAEEREEKKRQNKEEKRRKEKGEKPAKVEDKKPEKPKPKPQPENLAKRLLMQDIDFHTEGNTHSHNTEQYECTKQRKNDDGGDEEPELVVRRGWPMTMTFKFDRKYETKDNDLRIIFSTGAKPKKSQGTRADVCVDESGKKPEKSDDWWARMVMNDEKNCQVTVEIGIPPDCVVGEWDIRVLTIDIGKDKDGKDKTLYWLYKHDEPFYVLFNPFCEDDDVYMKDQVDREEYVMKEEGRVYYGSAYWPGSRPWNFGPFEEGILMTSVDLVLKGFGNKACKKMSSPVYVSRAISKMVNACDDEGVLVGNWSGNYEDGVSPTAWVGSVKILRQYEKTGDPVKYGQCWVFSALVTTVCRALGIPARSVTNFASAHDCDGSATIDTHYDEESNEIEWMNSDSVWNFHVWNDVWMKRRDLRRTPYEQCDWQAIDATPQESSDGVYQCGPAPLKAVKNGDCSIQFDTAFIFAEVNGDRVKWMHGSDTMPRVIEIETDSVGKSISTKQPGNPERLDVTNLYKHPEGSAEEREACYRANQQTGKAENLYTTITKEQDIRFQLLYEVNIMIGKDLDVTLRAQNVGDDDRNIEKVTFKYFTSDYTGKKTDPKPFKTKTLDSPRAVKVKEECDFKDVLKAVEYEKFLVEQASILIEAVGIVSGRWNQPAEIRIKTDVSRFCRPDLTVKPKKKEIKIGEAMDVEISFKNPLQTIALSGCDLTMESAGFRPFKPKPGQVQSVIKPQQEVKFDVQVTAKRAGKWTLGFSLDTRNLPDITGESLTDIQVKA